MTALNDLVLVRAAAGQVMFEIEVDGERFIRLAGDGVVAATPLGSSAYTLAAGGPLLAGGAIGLVRTPLSPHGGVCPPLVTGPDSRVTVRSTPATVARASSSTARCRGARAAHRLALELRIEQRSPRSSSLGEEESPIAGLRRRRILMDSPRVLARDDREARAPGRASRQAPPRAPPPGPAASARSRGGR